MKLSWYHTQTLELRRIMQTLDFTVVKIGRQCED